MKFRIVNTESWGYLDKEKYPQIKAEEHDDGTSMITINTIEELIELINVVDKNIFIRRGDTEFFFDKAKHDDDKYTIEIYDDYRE